MPQHTYIYTHQGGFCMCGTNPPPSFTLERVSALVPQSMQLITIPALGCWVFPRNCCCSASCREGKMILSAQSQDAAMSANEVKPRNPLGEVRDARWSPRVCKHAWGQASTQRTWTDSSDWWAVRQSGSICDKQEGLSDHHVCQSSGIDQRPCGTLVPSSNTVFSAL